MTDETPSEKPRSDGGSAEVPQASASPPSPPQVLTPITIPLTGLPGMNLGGLNLPPGFGLAGAALSMQSVQVWQGQYPPPEAVERFERVMPGAFDRILRMAENTLENQAHAMNQGRQFAHDDAQRAHYLGILAALAAMGCALLCVRWNQPWVAVAFLGVPVMAVAKALIDSARGQTIAQTLATAAQTHLPATTAPPAGPVAPEPPVVADPEKK